MTTNTLNSGAVDAAPERPIGRCTDVAVIGREIGAPVYRPDATGAPKKSWTLKTWYDAPTGRTADMSAPTVAA
jgi:hypothetical protein